MRLFIAINFNEEVKKKLMEIQNNLRGYTVQGNYTRKENLHLTLVFLGEIPLKKAELVTKAMDSFAAEAFTLSFAGWGRFKRGGHGRASGDIWWVGVEKNPTLNGIYQKLAFSLTSQGFVLEKREYKPHLTIAREVVLKDNFNKNQLGDIPSFSTFVNQISLMKSERINGTLTYTEVYTRAL